MSRSTDPRLRSIVANLGDKMDNDRRLSDSEKAQGFVRPVRDAYVHSRCGIATTLPRATAEAIARDPRVFGSKFCAGCKAHFPVNEFVWHGTSERLGEAEEEKHGTQHQKAGPQKR